MKRLKILILPVLLLLLPISGWSKNLTDEIIHNIYSAASADYIRIHPEAKIPDSPPFIGEFAEAVLQERSGITAGRILGLTDGAGIIIMLDDDLDLREAWGQGTLYHELIHYLQIADKGQTNSCEDALGREKEAYTMEAQWFRKHGEEMLFFKTLKSLAWWLQNTTCAVS